MGLLTTQGVLLFGREDVEVFEGEGILSENGTFAELICQMAKTVLSGEVLAIEHELVLGDACEGVGEECVDIVVDDVDAADLELATLLLIVLIRDGVVALLREFPVDVLWAVARHGWRRRRKTALV